MTAGDGVGLTLLEDGSVLITGGRTSKASDPTGCSPLLYSDGLGVQTADAYLYHPATDEIAAIAPMTAPRSGHATVRLDDGRVLLAGGNGIDADGSARALATAELFDPASTTFMTTGSLETTRGWTAALSGHVEPYATRLDDGTVLVRGGVGFSEGSFIDPMVGEIYDPIAGSFRTPGPDAETTARPVALPANGGCGLVDVCVDWYDPSSGSFSRAWRSRGNPDHQAAVLVIDGTRAYLVDGWRVTLRDLARDTEGEVPWATGGFRRWNALALLRDGSLLVAGGNLADTSHGGPTTEAELLIPGA